MGYLMTLIENSKLKLYTENVSSLIQESVHRSRKPKLRTTSTVV